MSDPLYGRRTPPYSPDAPLRVRVAQEIFLATRGKKHPANGGEHWHTADALLPFIRTLMDEAYNQGRENAYLELEVVERV